LESEPSLLARIWDFGSALLPYWWALVASIIFAVEPMIEGLLRPSWKDYIDQHWPRDKRHTHFRWAAAAALLIASFFAFDDVNKRNRELLKNSHETTQHADRREYIVPLQNFYIQGVAILQPLEQEDVTDGGIDNGKSLADHWAIEVVTWIQMNVGDAAAVRFLNLGDKPSYWYSISGAHSPDEIMKRRNTVNSLRGWLENIDILMTSSQWDRPDPTTSR
jgi:hypothetical protein